MKESALPKLEVSMNIAFWFFPVKAKLLPFEAISNAVTVFMESLRLNKFGLLDPSTS